MDMRVVFMGTPDFAVPSLQNLIKAGYEVVGVVTQPDRPKGRKQLMTKSPVKKYAEENDLDIFQPEKIREKAAINRVLAWKPDIIITAAYGQIIPVELLEAPKYKGINVHASLLPKFRGAAPIHQSIIQGEKETGITIMYMVKALDAGDILSQVKVPIADNDTVGTLHDKLCEAGSALLLTTLPKIEAGDIKPIPQDESLVTYSPTLKRSDELIDWNKTSTEVYNQVRGLNPWPVAFTYYKNEVFKLWQVKPINYLHNEQPGTIITVNRTSLTVATIDGAVDLLEVQPAGKRKMDIISFLQGTIIEVGEKLGEYDAKPKNS